MTIIGSWESVFGLNILIVNKLIQYFTFTKLQFVRFASYRFSVEKIPQKSKKTKSNVIFSLQNILIVYIFAMIPVNFFSSSLQ